MTRGSIHSKKWRDTHPEEAAAGAEKQNLKRRTDPEVKKRNRVNNIAWRKANPEAWRSIMLKCHYGITLEEYNVMLVAQNGVCLICRQPETSPNPTTKQPKPLSVDHDHTTGKVRGLLCSRCNVVIGFMKEDTVRIRAMADYLERNV